jgi:hypothetical protein
MSHHTQDSYPQVRINYPLFVPDVSHPLESGDPAASQTVHTYGETSRNEASLQMATDSLNLTRESAVNLKEERALSNKSSVKSTDVSNIHDCVDQTGDTARKSHAIFNGSLVCNSTINPSNHFNMPCENRSRTPPNDQLFGTVSENHLKMFVDHHNSPASLDRRMVNVTTGNFSNHSEALVRSAYTTVDSQPRNLSTEHQSVYPSVAAENSYIILHDLIKNSTERSTTQSISSSRNSTQTSSVQFIINVSEGHSTGTCKHSIENACKQSNISTENLSNISTDKHRAEHLNSNRTESEGNKSGKGIDTSSRIPLRRTRDHSNITDHRSKTSKENESRNISENDEVRNVTADTSDGHVVNKSSHSEAEFPNVPSSNGSTRNTSTNLGGHFITISVENSHQYPSILTGNASRTSSNPTGKSSKSSSTSFENTTEPTSSDALKNSSVGEWSFLC